MIIKGTSRAGPSGLAAHLGNAEANERVQVMEARGTVAQDLRGALLEMDAYAAGTRCEKSLYHAAISPEPPHGLTAEQRAEAIDALEQKLGLDGHARIIVIHEKHDREHIHVVWSRIDLETMKSVSDSHNYRKHEEVARDLERRFGHDRVQGAHHERDGVERPDRTPSRSELRQEERTGITGKQVRAEVTAAFRASDGAEAFKAALEDAGYVLAKGDRRDFVVLDREGGIHSLARRLDGVKAAELREFMSPLDRDEFPTVEQAKEIQEARRLEQASSDDRERKESLDLQAEQERRAREARDARADDKVEAAYARGDDYVSQSRAAQRDHKRRQEDLNDRSQDAAAEAQPQQEPGAANRHAASLDPSPIDEIELTDEMRKRLDQLPDPRVGNSRSPDDPDRQPEAPGGGHTRSR